MSDVRLRELERAAAAGDREASGRLLREQIRTDALARDRLDLAAYLGDPTARRVASELDQVEGQLDGNERWVDTDALALEDWIRGLEGHSREATVRAAIAVGRAVLATWEASAGWQIESTTDGAVRLEPRRGAPFTIALAQALAPRRALEAAEAWVTCPCRMHVIAAEEASWGSSPEPASVCCQAVARAMAVPDFAVQAVHDACAVFEADAGDPAGAQRRAREVIRTALVPWALEADDPVWTQPRLAPPSPELREWVQRGWSVTWSRRREGVALRVELGEWSVEHVERFGVAPPGGYREAAVRALDARLWRERRWLPPGLEGQGYTRTLRVLRDSDQAAPQAQGTSAR